MADRTSSGRREDSTCPEACPVYLASDTPSLPVEDSAEEYSGIREFSHRAIGLMKELLM